MIKGNLKTIFAFVLGLIISGVTAYAISVVGSDISYDNSTSGLTSTNVQDAIDELYVLGASGSGLNIPSGYMLYSSNRTIAPVLQPISTVTVSNWGNIIVNLEGINTITLNNLDLDLLAYSTDGITFTKFTTSSKTIDVSGWKYFYMTENTSTTLSFSSD